MARTTTPVIRIGAVDSVDHITEYDSAADHTLTLKKWQEMNLHISAPSQPNKASNVSMQGQRASVFEESIDRTEATAKPDSRDMPRWKYEGPWLAGFTEGEFQIYVGREIKRRRSEFRQFLRNWLLERKGMEQRRSAIEKGEASSNFKVGEVSEEEFDSNIKELRHQKVDLWQVIWQFLDLPKSGITPAQGRSALDEYADATTQVEPELGPPKTHPSAGLSYLRTGSHVHNHPVLGPMSTQPPIHARILQPGSQSLGVRRGRVVLGVGGVAATDTSYASTTFGDQTPGWSKFEPDMPGGPKAWVHPQATTIDSRGRIKLTVEKAQDNSLAVWEGKQAGEELSPEVQGKDRTVPILDQPPQSNSGTGFRRREAPLKADADKMVEMIRQNMNKS